MFNDFLKVKQLGRMVCWGKTRPTKQKNGPSPVKATAATKAIQTQDVHKEAPQ